MCRPEKVITALTHAAVCQNEPVAEDTLRMVLAVPFWQGEDPAPGQFLMLSTTEDSDPLLARPFGISGFRHDGEKTLVEIIYRVVGRGTLTMSRWRPGQPAAFLGPLGKGFVLPPEGTASLLVAGGVGLPPLLALARTMEKLGRSGELTLLYGDGRQGLLIDPGSDMFPKVRTLTCTEDGSCGTRGMVTGLLEGVNLGEGAHLYVCGPNPMMRAVLAATGSRCLSAHYSLEARMACGFGVCSGCAVKMASGEFVRVCREGPVFDGTNLSLDSFGEV